MADKELSGHDPELVGEKFKAEGGPEATFEEPQAGFVKKSPLTEESFDDDVIDEQLAEAREREVQLSNFIGQQAKLIESLTKAVEDLKKDVRSNQEALETELLKKTGTKKEGDNLYQQGPSVTPPSQWNIPSAVPLLTSEDDNRSFTNTWTGELPVRIKNPHRSMVRINDLKLDKDAEGLSLNPYEVVDLPSLGFTKKHMSISRGLKYALQRGMVVPATAEDSVGLPAQEPDSIQKRFADHIGKVPRRGKVRRNEKTGKLEKEQGIMDPQLESAAQQHIQQETVYDAALRDQREYEESGSNVV